MGFHHDAHIERLETLEQPVPQNGEQPRRGQDLRELMETMPGLAIGPGGRPTFR